MPEPLGGVGRRLLRSALVIEQEGRCAYCDVEIIEGARDDYRAATLDHIVSLDQGGTDERSNFVACCSRCNHAKSNLTPTELRRMADRIEAMIRERFIGPPTRHTMRTRMVIATLAEPSVFGRMLAAAKAHNAVLSTVMRRQNEDRP